MELRDIENLSAAELKERRDELAEAAAAKPAAQVAARMVKWLTDAKLRDEKLGEQGRTITALQDALEAAKARAETAAGLVSKYEQRIGQLEQQRRDAAEYSRKEIADLQTAAAAASAEHTRHIDLSVAAEQEALERCRRLKVQATTHAKAITAIHKLTADSIAAARLAEADAPV